MKLQEPIHAYYENIAQAYDSNRFDNTYGAFIHHAEEAFLKQWLNGNAEAKVLNLGCGTGRFMEYATDGLDFSENMLGVAKGKYPGSQFHHADARSTGFRQESFDTVFCLHVLMHHDKASVNQILEECHRILKPNGLLLVDFPSARRRQYIGRKQQGWHGANAYTLSAFQNLVRGRFKLVETGGILFLPIHRLPKSFRRFIYPIDKALCRSSFLELSSYLMLVLCRC